ncbi:MAG: hypothetical protein FWG40_01755 [Peptococcaceae bacterium]|jgi:hypothetical protein|nr:hypothetical protein [Peptococcaceae bacterium]
MCCNNYAYGYGAPAAPAVAPYQAFAPVPEFGGFGCDGGGRFAGGMGAGIIGIAVLILIALGVIF